MCFESVSAFPTNPAGGTPLTLSDDDSFAAVLGGGAQVVLYGESYDTVYVGSNGYLTFGSEDFQWADSPASHFALPRVSALFRDLDPESGGTISWQQLSDRAAFTFQNVPEFLLGNSNSFQVELFFDGIVTITYLQMDSTFGIAGVSAGEGAPLDFVESNLSASDACDALRVTPGTVLSSSGFQGGSFTPASKTYTLTNANHCGAVQLDRRGHAALADRDAGLGHAERHDPLGTGDGRIQYGGKQPDTGRLFGHGGVCQRAHGTRGRT